MVAVFQTDDENENIPQIRVVASSGQEIVEVERPALDVEYTGVPPFQRINLIVRVPRIMSQYRSTLVDLGARYYSMEKLWRLPAYLCLALAAEETFVAPWLRRRSNFKIEEHIDFSDAYLEWRDIATLKFDDLIVPERVKATWDKLYPFQQEGVRWLVENPYEHRGTLLAISPGMGKSIVALTAAAILDLQRVLIIAPLSLLQVWQYEKAKWFGKAAGSRLPARLHSVHGETPPDTGWVVTNYNTVVSAKRIADFCEYQWDLIIIDESIQIKNRKSQRFMNIKALCQNADRVWELSGSPISRTPADLWAQFNLIDQRGFPSFWRFTKRWASTEETQWGTKITGSAGRDLRSDFRDVMFVKNQEEVLPDLPDMRFEHIACPLQYVSQQYRVYKKMAESFIAELEGADEEIAATTKLAQMTRLQQIASNVINLSSSMNGSWPDASVKADTLVDMIDSEAVEYPMLVWTHWTPGAKALLSRVEGALATSAPGLRAGVITGSLSEEERTELFRRFKGSNNAFTDADIDVLILSLGVGKFGLSMQKTKTIVYMDKSFHMDDYVQSLFRVRRIGLTHSPRCITLHAPGTIDEIVEENLAGKSIDIARVTNADLAKMLRSLNRQLDTGMA